MNARDAWPRALRPWGPELEKLSASAGALMARWLPRLDAQLGRARRRPTDAGEVDGYGGLASRGPYERLLLSELGWLESVPEEFVRRAAFGEQGFLQLERRAPRDERRMVVLFDAGPEQVGLPRLAHLAILLLAHSRARHRRAKLSWGLIHAPEAVQTEMTAEGLGLFARRGYPSPADAETLLEALAAHEVEEDAVDLWVVSAGRLAEEISAWGGRSLVVREVLRIRDAELTVTDGEEDVALPLPPPHEAHAILLDPTQLTLRPSRIISAREGAPALLVGRKAQHLVQVTEGGLRFARLAEPPGRSTGWHSVPLGGHVLAVGARGRNLHVLEGLEQGKLRLASFDRHGALNWSETLQTKADLVIPGRDTPPSMLYDVGRRRRELGFLDPLHGLRRFRLEGEVELGESKLVVAVGQASAGLWIAQTTQDGFEITVDHGDERLFQTEFDALTQPGLRPLMAAGGALPAEPLLIYCSVSLQWRARRGRRDLKGLQWPYREGTEIIGGILWSEGRIAQALLLRIDPTRRRLFIEGPGGLLRRELSFDEEILRWQLAPSATPWLLLEHATSRGVFTLPKVERVAVP